ncbi:MAG: zinc-binding dehydrogenase [Planctomycetota bacterium]|nr:zinc-binding dehydrogenase [Planctomycetota bacterium]
MRTTALEFVERGKLGIYDLGDPPEPGPSHVLIETKYTGVTNGTERHAFMSEFGYGGNFPCRHGYQQVGEIIAVGTDVTAFRSGDWVFYGQYVGHNGWNLADQGSLLFKLPKSIERRYCALFGVAGVALRSVRRMGVGQGDNVLVFGQGPIGHFVGQTARASGAKVTVADVLEKRLEAARQCGAHAVLDAADATFFTTLEEGGPYNFIYDCCSAESLLFDIQAHGLLAHGGTIGMVAVRENVTYPWRILHGTEAKIETSCHFGLDDLRVLVFLYEQGLVKIEPMVSHCVSIDEASRIYEMLGNRDEELLGTIFDWSQADREP